MKFKMFLNKVWCFLKKFPVFLLLGIFIPPAIYAGQYLFQSEHTYNNLFYGGEKIEGNPRNFEITAINPLLKVSYSTVCHCLTIPRHSLLNMIVMTGIL